MATSTLPLARRAMASASLAASAGGLAMLAVGGSFGAHLLLGVSAAVAAAAAVAIGLRGVAAHVLARGVAWTLLVPTLPAVVSSALHGQWPDGYAAFFAATSAGALLLARPMLHTDEARGEFDPVAYRRVFLAGATASAAAGAALGVLAVGLMSWGRLDGPLTGVLASAFLASAVGVARMRSWGVLLGMVITVGAMVVALLSGREVAGLAMALGTPGALLAAPLFAVRLGKRSRVPASRGATGGASGAAVPRRRVDAAVSADARVRVAALPDEAEPLGDPAVPRGLAQR